MWRPVAQHYFIETPATSPPALRANGYVPFFVVDDTETALFTGLFASSTPLGALSWPAEVHARVDEDVAALGNEPQPENHQQNVQ